MQAFWVANKGALTLTKNSFELHAAIGSLEIAFESAPVGVKGANGVAERMVRTVVEGSRTLLENAGFAMRCFCLLYNVTPCSENDAANVEWSHLCVDV